jgi:Rieske Fe-S protein
MSSCQAECCGTNDYTQICPNSLESARGYQRSVLTVCRQDGDVLGVYRDDAGGLHAVDAICPHLGCLVQWNDGERTWDCPCHGSRFELDGRVINGPANTDLSSKDM